MSDIKKHARLSPSGSYRWMTCSGSVALEDGKPDDYNDYSDEGTCAHAIAAMCLTEGRPATAYIGRRVTMQDDGPPRTYEFREDMAEPVQRYVDHIRAYRGDSENTAYVIGPHELFVEQELPIGHVTGEEGATGTGDAIIITSDQEEIQVHDLKFGMGVRVSAVKNPQGMLYALGALEKYDITGSVKRVRIVIHQPRLSDAPSEWDCTVEELLEFAKEASARAKDAMTAFEFRVNWMGKDDSYLVPSTEACRFCKAKAANLSPEWSTGCPALNKKIEDTVGASFDVIVENDAVPYDPQDTDTPARLSTVMKATDLIEVWIKAIRAEVERRLLAGGEVPEFKIVEGRQGNRAWINKDEAEALLKSFRLRQEEMYSFELISPTAAEALLKKESPKRWTKAQTFITRKPGAKSVAHISDKRPAVTVTPAVDAFEVDNAEDIT